MSQPYEPLADRGKAARIALGAVIALGVVNALSEVAEIRLLGRLIDGEVLSPSSLEASDSRAALLGVLQFVASVAAAVFFIRWFYRAYRNLDALGSPRRHSTGWAIGGWFVPILALFRPKQILDDIWSGTQRRADTTTSAPPLLMIWWVGFVLSQTVANVVFRLTFSDDGTAEELQRSDYAWIFSDCSTAPSGCWRSSSSAGPPTAWRHRRTSLPRRRRPPSGRRWRPRSEHTASARNPPRAASGEYAPQSCTPSSAVCGTSGRS